jgi:hypothetical protein
MFNGLKALLGGGNQASAFAMIKPMLPMIKKQAKPALKAAFQEKVDSLKKQLPEPLRHDENLQQEITPFITIRNGEFVAQWVVLDHFPDAEFSQIGETLESITLDEILDEVTSSVSYADDEAEVTEEPGFKYEVQTHGEPTEQPEKLLVRAGATSQEQLFRLQRYLVVKIEGTYQVIQGPPPESATVYFDHNDEEIAQDFAELKNAQ